MTDLPLKEQNGHNGIVVQPTEKEIRWSDRTLYQKYEYLKSHITVEPMLACYIMPSCLAGLATQNLNLEKACRVNLQYEKHICDALSSR